MKILPARARNRALSRPEVIVIMAVVGLLAVFFMPRLFRRKIFWHPPDCVRNLKQVALAFRLWTIDNGDRYPMAFYTNDAGGPAFADSSNAFRYFQVMSNELQSPRLLVCPQDQARRFATNFTSDFNNQRISYFLGLEADESNPNMFLAGDRNVTNGLPLKNGLLRVDTNRVVGWTHQIHHGAGNIAVTDGSVQRLTSSGLNSAVRASGVTNWLLFP